MTTTSPRTRRIRFDYDGRRNTGRTIPDLIGTQVAIETHSEGWLVGTFAVTEDATRRPVVRFADGRWTFVGADYIDAVIEG